MLASLIGSIASGEALLALRRAKTTAIVYAIVGLLALVGVIFLLIAGYLFAASRFGPIEAALGFGGGFLLLGIVVLIVYNGSLRARQRRRAERRTGEISTVAGASALALLPMLANRRAGLPMLLAPLLGFVGYKIYQENATRRPRFDDDD